MLSNEIKLFVALEIQYFQLRIFSFNSYLYYVTMGFIASTRAFNLVSRAFNPPTRAFNLATCGFSLLTRGFELVNRVLLFHSQTISSWPVNKCFFYPSHKETLSPVMF